MAFKYVLLVFVLGLCHGEKDDKKWVWSENNRNSNSRSISVDHQNPKSRYNIYEGADDYRPTQYYPNGPINQRPTPVYENRPPASGVGFIPEQRPGGVYGGRPVGPTYGNQGNHYPAQENQGVLTGPVPSWLREGPIKNFDKCKCAEKFNCNSPGISYGHCDVGKQYCCYSTKKDLGGPIPSKPVHSIENGVLVGPGGPIDPIPGVNNYPRPSKQLGNGFYRPGGFREPNEYSPANGVLVGPGGPYDSSPYGLGRSAKAGVKTK